MPAAGNARAGSVNDCEARYMFEVGRLCMKIAGREAGKYCVIVKKMDDNFVLITGPRELTSVKRRRCNMNHLEPMLDVLKIKSDAADNDVLKAYQQANLTKKLGLEPGKPARKAEKRPEKKEPKKEKAVVKKPAKKDARKEKPAAKKSEKPKKAPAKPAKKAVKAKVRKPAAKKSAPKTKAKKK